MGITQDRGREAEDRAAAWLADRGLQLLARNYRCRGGEIDLVMRDASHLVFVEVRYRSRNDFGGALSSVGPAKQRRLLLAAQHYLARNGWTGPCRFDVVGFEHDGKAHWIRDAFGA